jgi:hypothetical protein
MPDENDHLCNAHSGLASRVGLLIWLLSGVGALILTVGMWNISILYDIRGTLEKKSDSSDLITVRQQLTENKMRIDNLDILVRWGMSHSGSMPGAIKEK